MPEQHSPETLERMAEGVSYEVYQLAACSQLLNSGIGRWFDDVKMADVIRYAILDSALVHSRSLDDFLGLTRTDESRDDDVFGSDFDPRWQPRRVLSADERDSVNKLLAHLTTRRATGPQSWELAAFDRTLSAFGTFLDGLESREPDRRSWFKIERKVAFRAAPDYRPPG